MYAILIISLLLVLGTLKTLQNRKTIIDKVKSETVDALDIKNYDDLLVALESLDAKVRTLENGFLDKTYPVGSIYISIENDKTPSELFGGTWEQIGQGRTLIGAGTNGGYTFTAGSIGTTVGATTNPLGEYVHTLSVAEMPSHSHDYYFDWNPNINWGIGLGSGSSYSDRSAVASGPQGRVYTFAIRPTGGSESHNNIQPYIVTYMWKRTS